MPATDLLEHGIRLRGAGKTAQAEENFRQAASVDPHSADAWAELGCLLLDSRRYAEAVSCFEHVLRVADGESEPSRKAIGMLEAIASARPGWGRGQFSLGCAYELAGEHQRARERLVNALALDRAWEAPIQSLFARMFWTEGNLEEAIAAADRALEANPATFLAHVIRSRCYSALGQMTEAVESNRKALAIEPNREFHSYLLFEMSFLPGATPEALYAEACRWNSLYAAPLAAGIKPHANVPDPERRLKIGYVSPDVCWHAMMKFLPPVLERHDRVRFEVFLYSVGSLTDDMTDQVRTKVDNFVPIPGSPDRLAGRVRADGIDILVDLAGHTMGPAYLAFAKKPAPVQISWLGVLGTTGLSTMDYFLGEALMPCPGTEHQFSETVYRLPRIGCCYRPFGEVPVAPAPCLERGYITFGAFHKAAKINREVVKLWSAILHLTPASRLLLKYKGMETQPMQGRFRNWFAEDGVAPERIEFEGPSLPLEYLASFARVDIALDPFPYNGGTTTLDTLWMGVPVVTLAGRLAVQSTGVSVLTAAGLPDLAANTPERYLEIAMYLAQAVREAPDLRANVRRALASSPIMDEAGLVRCLEDAYRDMWRKWCRGGKTK